VGVIPLGYPADEETCGNVTRLVPTQLPRFRFRAQLTAGVRVRRDKPARCERVEVSDSEGLATHAGPESCAAPGNGGSEALTGECAGRVLSPEIAPSGCRRAPNTRKATPWTPSRRGGRGPGGVGDPWHARKHRVRDPGGPAPGLVHRHQARAANPKGTAAMHGGRESDSSIVPRKRPNKVEGRTTMRSRDQAETAEAVEGRELAKGKTGEHTRVRTQCRSARQRALDRIRQAARRDRAKPLTALWHHVYDVNRLREAYYGLNRKAAPGVDGQTWAAYGEHLEVNLRDLSERLKRGAYHARPVERVSIPKPDGRQRPIGIPMCPAYCIS